jgi:hypothetical protein
VTVNQIVMIKVMKMQGFALLQVIEFIIIERFWTEGAISADDNLLRLDDELLKAFPSILSFSFQTIINEMSSHQRVIQK